MATTKASLPPVDIDKTPGLAVMRKIHALREEIKEVESSKMDSAGMKYNYLSENKLTTTIRPVMQKLGLVAVPVESESKTNVYGMGLDKNDKERFVLLTENHMVAFSKKFFGKPDQAAADVSVDSNANVDDISIIAYEAEVPKPLFRVNAYYLLWKYGKKLFSKEEAEKLCTAQFYKDFYINDFHKFATTPYCFNFSCLDVVFSGLPFVNKIRSLPPKHLNSFVNQMIQFVTYASNSVAGAVGLADFLICLSYFYDKEIVIGATTDADVKQQIQSFIFSVNQPFRGGHQSAFTNVSLFDDNFLQKMCKEYRFPDGSQPNPETVKKLQVMYMDVMNETLEKTPCTFPVTTACFSVDENREINDIQFLKIVCEENLRFGWINLPFLYEQADKVIQFYDLIDTVYVTGGDLLCQSDRIAEDFTNALVCTMPLVNYFWLFTGCEEKYLPSWIWKYYDIVKCGNYREDMLNPTGSFPASKNQKLLFNKKRKPILQYKFDTIEFMGEKKWK